jgi:hypothetical protein
MTFHDLLRTLNDQSFKPFRIKLSNAAAIDITEPGTCIVGQSSAVVPTELTDIDGYRYVRNWRTISISHIVQFADIDVKENGSRRKRK